MRKPDFDINVEYEKLFGTAKRINLFDEDEDYYNKLRLDIINAPVQKIPHKTETFQNINIFPVEEKIQRHIFLIEGQSQICNCSASGYYSEEDNHFVLQKGSRFSLIVSLSFYQTSREIKRREVIKQNCIKEENGFILKNDIACESPSTAACYVLGRLVNGWLVWRDHEGKTLKEVYKKED